MLNVKFHDRIVRKRLNKYGSFGGVPHGVLPTQDQILDEKTFVSAAIFVKSVQE